MNHTIENSKICIRCHECCQWMTFILRPEGPELLTKYIEFYEQRGCTVTINPEGAYWDKTTLSIMVPCKCPKLMDSGYCRIYGTRPALCWDYDGRWDPHMADKCQLIKGEFANVPPKHIELPEGHVEKMWASGEHAMAEHRPKDSEEVTELSVDKGPNPFFSCPFCGILDPGDMVCSSCGKLMRPPEDNDA